MRATLLLRAPDLSDDLSRYVWDARVAASGISPYAHAPADPAVADIAPDLRGRVAHADVRTVYPPVAQAAFRAGLGLGLGAAGLKAVFAAADLSVVALLLAMGGPGAGYGAALYAFHPLAVTESAGQGHLDSLGIALLLAGFVYLAREKPARGGVAFALSVLTKYVSLAAVLPLARRGRLLFAVAAAATGAGLWIAATRAGVTPLGGLPDYATRWEFNSLAYPALSGFFERADLASHVKDAFIAIKSRMGDPAWMDALFPFFYDGLLARAGLAALLAAVLAVIGWRVRDMEAAAFASLAALLLASPTLHPWYLLWVLPFAARRREPAFLYLSFAVALSYALLYPVPRLSRPVVLLVEYAPFAVLLVRSLVKAPSSAGCEGEA